MAAGNITNGGEGAAQPTYKWRRSDADFVRLAGSKANDVTRSSRNGIRVREQPKVVDSVSCRQMFLRSYTFSRKESFRERTKKRFRKIVRAERRFRRRTYNQKEAAAAAAVARRRTTCLVVVRRVKEASCAALLAMFRRFLFCTAKVDILADHNNGDLP